MRVRPAVCLVLCSLGLLAFSGCRKGEDVWPSAGKKRVLVSFPPLYSFTKNVAGDHADVRCLLTTQGPHDFEPTSNDVLLARKADLVLINGLGLDEWLTKLVGKGQVKVLEVAETIPEKQLRRLGEAEKHEGHDHGSQDPHVWLSPPLAKLMVAAIAGKLGEIDPANKNYYQERAHAYSEDLDKLYAQGKAAFAGKNNRNMLAMHDSLHYFADAFGLTVIDHLQPRPGIEADAQKLTGLVSVCKEKGVRVIAVEPQYPQRHAEALKKELASRGVTVELVEVDPLETAPAAPNKTDPDPAYYMQRMHRNLDNLAKAFQ
jgi:zinc transport system substrate-binding protein